MLQRRPAGEDDRLVVGFTIGPDGRVARAVIAESTVGAEMDACVLALVRSFAFPRPNGGGAVRVRYPFLFRPAE